MNQNISTLRRDEPQPTVPAALVSRGEFCALLDAAVAVAEPGSEPVLLLIELAGLRDGNHDPATQTALAEAASATLAEVLGDQGYVCALRQGRLGVITASDNAAPAEARSTALLAALARPIVVGGTTLTPGAALSTATWGDDGETVEELFVAADRRICEVTARASTTAADRRANKNFKVQQSNNIRFVASPLCASA